MDKDVLHNGFFFPNYVFNAKVLDYIFIEFNYIFKDEFLNVFKVYLERKGISRLVIENIEPKDYFFHEEIAVNFLPQSFKESACSNCKQDYIESESSFYMLTEKGIISASKEKDIFCLVLDREYDIGIFGASTNKDLDLFREFAIKDLKDYLTLSFNGNNLPSSFSKEVNKNWKDLLLAQGVPWKLYRRW